MKTKSIISILIFIMSACVLTTSCEDMLTPDLDRYATDKKYGQDSVYSALGILRSIQNISERTILLDACRSDLVTSGTYTTDSISNLIDFANPEDGSSALLNVADFYHVVNSCNFYLANVDTTITENNVKIMQREWAEVQAMRAWAYIQLVRFYGEVPFVTTPVASTDEAEQAQKSAPKVNASNLIASLNENGLTRAYELQKTLGLPDYESFNNGDISFDSKRNFFPIQIVMADAYLMNDDYENAARLYYDFMYYDDKLPQSTYNNKDYRAKSSEDRMSKVKQVNSGSWINSMTTNALGNSDIITTAVGASNSANGTVLQRIPAIYGFKTTISSSGAKLTATENYQQVIPSQQYVTLNKAQSFNAFEVDGELQKKEIIDGGDGRLYAAAPQMSFMNGDKSRIIDKFSPYTKENKDGEYIRYNNFETNYLIPFYRLPVILLRYAEAVNRMGFPELAFGVLKDGLIKENIPTYGTVNIYKETEILNEIRDLEEDTVIRVDTIPGVIVGKLVNDGLSATVDYTVDSTAVVYGDKYLGNFIPAETYEGYEGTTLADIPEDVQSSWADVEYILDPTAASGGMYYMSLDERKAMEDYPFMDFTDSKFSNSDASDNATHVGLHSRGCGDNSGKCDTIYTYARQVAEKVAEDYARKNGLSYADQQAYAKTLYSGDTLLVTDKATIQNAVENIIVDEIALETAFEGNRFTDLIRIAEHKTKAGLDGTAWLAWKIARRNQNYTDDASQVDASLKSKLSNKSNWYLALPK